MGIWALVMTAQPPKISALKRFPAFSIHGMFEEKTRTLEARDPWIQKPQETRRTGNLLESLKWLGRCWRTHSWNPCSETQKVVESSMASLRSRMALQFWNHNNLFEFGDNCITCVQLYHAVSSTHCYTIHPWKCVNIQPSRWIRWSMTSMQRSSGFPMASCHGGMRSWTNLWVCWAHHRTFSRMARRNSRRLLFWLKKGT